MAKTSWIVTLDVLKLLKVFISASLNIRWIVTLDVLK